MNIYYFDSTGIYLTAKFAIVAATEPVAWELARESAADQGLDPTSLKLNTLKPFEPPCVVYVWNGDY